MPSTSRCGWRTATRPASRSRSPTSSLNKAELVPRDELEALEARLRAINPTAVIHRIERCGIAADQIMDRRAFDLERILEIEPDFLSEDAHEHDEAVKSGALHRQAVGRQPLRGLDWRSAATARPGHPQEQGHPVGCRQPRSLHLPRRAHADGRRRRQTLGRGRGAAFQARVHRARPQCGGAAGRLRILRRATSLAAARAGVRPVHEIDGKAGVTGLAYTDADILGVAVGDGALRTLHPDGSSASAPLHDGAILHLAVDVDGTGFVTGDDDGRLVRTGGEEAHATLFERRGRQIDALAVSRAARRIAIGVGNSERRAADRRKRLRPPDHRHPRPRRSHPCGPQAPGQPGQLRFPWPMIGSNGTTCLGCVSA